ncbi:MAG: peptidoglycan DD-metalloendopeptidase family protein [Clostridia bacterium]|nr:peptidoglycan DD-metalloendopeptidase family protein [Clostridia bacterium]
MSFRASRLMGTLIMVVVMSFVTVGLMSYDTLTVFANTTTSGKTIHELENSLKNAQSEEKKLKASMQNAASQAASYEAQIIELDSEISNLTEQLTLIENLVAEWNKDKEETEKKIADLEAKKEAEIQTFEAMLRMSYQYGSDTYFNLIFGSQDIGDFLSRTDLIGYHLKANDNILDSLSGTLSELEDANEQYTKSIQKIDSYGTSQKELQKQLEERSEYARQKKLEFEADEAKYKSQLSAKSSEMAKMQAEIQAYYAEQRRNGNTQKYEGGTFFLPLPAGSYRISSEYANRISPITGKRENHNGLDMAAPGGTDIYAAAGGTVIDSRYSSSWGNVIQIDHGGGLVTLYAHCSYRGVQKGQTVSKGQFIGRVGTTGWSTGNHLHFTVYENGVAVNPRKYLPAGI